MEKQNFLLSQAEDVSIIYQESWVYDNDLHLNTIKNANGTVTPVCSNLAMITGSKTMAAPGDDDPDPDAESCY